MKGRAIKYLTEREKILLERAKAFPYKTLNSGDELSIHFYIPKDIKEGFSRPVFLFFGGGAWDRGSLVQFAPQALYFAERGAVCGLVEYRNKSTHPDSNPVEALQDGQSAVRFVRHFSEKLHINPEKVVVFGAAAGGNIAGSAAMGAKLDVDDESDRALSDSVPNGAVLFSSIIDVAKDTYGFDQFKNGGDIKKVSLSRYIDGKIPPMLILHGTEDRLIPFFEVSEFAAKLEKKKAPCKLVEFEGRDHSFFNLNVDPVSYEACLTEVDQFLDKNHFLEKHEDEPDDSRLISWREYDY